MERVGALIGIHGDGYYGVGRTRRDPLPTFAGAPPRAAVRPSDNAFVDVPVDLDDVALLEGGALSAPKPPLPHDEEVAVAVWRGGALGAILSIWHDPDDEEEPFAQDITVFELVNGVWTWRSTGGSDWPVDYGERLAYNTPVFTGTGASLPSPDGRSLICLSSGIAPPRVERVRVEQDGLEAEADVEPVTGAFLVALPDWPNPLTKVSSVFP